MQLKKKTTGQSRNNNAVTINEGGLEKRQDRTQLFFVRKVSGLRRFSNPSSFTIPSFLFIDAPFTFSTGPINIEKRLN